MPSAIWTDFLGGTYLALSPTMAAEQAVNVYLEMRKVPGSPKQGVLYGTPGLRLVDTVATTVSRGSFTQDGLSLRVVGPTLYEFDPVAETETAIGPVANDGALVSFASNGPGGNQIAIVSAGQLYIVSLLTMTLSGVIALPFSNPVMVIFSDGYFLINERDTPKVWFSALFDGTSWDALDFFARSGTSDHCVAIATTLSRVWFLGSETSTQFYDAGDADTPFLPYPGTVTQVGIVAWTALAIYDDQLCWVALGPRVVSTRDGLTVDISTPPIALFLSRCTTLADVEMLAYEQAGHIFYAMTCPSSPDDIKTYVYDYGEQLWHARAGWDDNLGVDTRWRARGCTVRDGVPYVGDFETGDHYALDLETYADNGAILRRMRQSPYLSADNQVLTVFQFQLGAQAGVGLSSGQGSDPQITLEVTRDGGQTWASAGNASPGAIGEYGATVKWGPLGTGIEGLWAFRVTQTDPIKTAWGPGVWLRTEKGTGQR